MDSLQSLGRTQTGLVGASRGLATSSIRTAPLSAGGSALNAPIRFAGDMIRKHVIEGKPVNMKGVMDSGLRAAHPALLVIDAASQQMGGPSLQDAFVRGVTATGDVRVPPLPF